MGYLTRADLPYYHALADAAHSLQASSPLLIDSGPTHPNRYYPDERHHRPGWSGTAAPRSNNEGNAYSWETYPERLRAPPGSAGRSTTTSMTTTATCSSTSPSTKEASHLSAARVRAEGSAVLRAAGRLALGQHSASDLGGAAVGLSASIPTGCRRPARTTPAQVLEALWANPALWAKTALILNYDENDGLFDHVAPPVAAARYARRST